MTPLGDKPFENTVEKCFSTCLHNFLPFSSNLKLSSADCFSLEESKICHLVMVKSDQRLQHLSFSCCIIIIFLHQQVDENTEIMNPTELKKSKTDKDGLGDDEEETIDDTDNSTYDIPGDKVDTMTVARGFDSTIHTALENFHIDSLVINCTISNFWSRDIDVSRILWSGKFKIRLHALCILMVDLYHPLLLSSL